MPCNLIWDPTLRIDWSWYGLSCINDNKWTDWKCLSRSRSGFPIHALFSLAVANFRGWREVLVTNGIAGWTLKKMWQQLSICLRNGEKKRAKKKKRMKCKQHADWGFFFREKYAYSRAGQYETPHITIENLNSWWYFRSSSEYKLQAAYEKVEFSLILVSLCE